MKIRTSHWLKPIPLRDFDWEAVDEDTYDEGEPVGLGRTEKEAIADLIDQLLDREQTTHADLVK